MPLLWAAVEGDANNPMVRWLVGAAKRVPRVVVAGVDMSGADASVIGWETLRDVLHARGLRSRKDMAEWIHSQGFPMPRWGAHFSGRRVMNIAIAADARVSALESLFVQLVLVECQGGDRHPLHFVPRASDRNDGSPVSFPDSCWKVLDTVDLQGVFQCRLSERIVHTM